MHNIKYITKSDLSVGPQFGSQMTQYAGLYSISKKTHHNIVFFEKFFNVHRGIKILYPFKNISAKLISNNILENNIFHSYTLIHGIKDDNAYKLNSNMNWDIRGSFDLFYYWHDIRSEILKEFEFKDVILEKAKKFIHNISDSNTPIVSMHFRRTDYLQVSSLNLTLDYYWEALQYFIKKLSYFKIIVFSDDIEWCKNNVIGEDIVYSENNDQYVDMCIMTLCNHNIIANSSFSWWGAYLNNNSEKIVICPDRYVNDINFNFINYNYYPKEWVSLKI